MAYAPLALANTFIERHGDSGIEHMKLQKLTYYAYGWWLVYEAEPILIEGPEVWKFGPVFSSLYNVMSPFGSRPIREPQRSAPFGAPPSVHPDDERSRSLVAWVLDRYGAESSFDLSNETHKQGTPWQVEAERHRYRVPRHHRIPDDLIRQFFQREAAQLQPA